MKKSYSARMKLAGWFYSSVFAVAVLGSGCLYTNVHQPYGYHSATPADVKAAPADEAVSGDSCSRSILFLVAWGDAGYAAATTKALEGKPGAVLYDVKADVHVNSYLFGLYSRVCTIVTGRVGRT